MGELIGGAACAGGAAAAGVGTDLDHDGFNEVMLCQGETLTLQVLLDFRLLKAHDRLGRIHPRVHSEAAANSPAHWRPGERATEALAPRDRAKQGLPCSARPAFCLL